MLSDLFQDRPITPAPNYDNKDNVKTETADKTTSSGDHKSEEASEREIVDILLAADLGLIFY